MNKAIITLALQSSYFRFGHLTTQLVKWILEHVGRVRFQKID